MKKYEYTEFGSEYYSEWEFSSIQQKARQGWRLIAVVPFSDKKNKVPIIHFFFEREISEPQKPDYSNASIAKANELLTDDQRKQAIPSLHPNSNNAQTFGGQTAYIKKVFLSALGEYRFECYTTAGLLISGSYGSEKEAEDHIRFSGYIFTGEVVLS